MKGLNMGEAATTIVDAIRQDREARESELAAKDAELARLRDYSTGLHDFVVWLSQRHEHDGLTKSQIIRMAARMDVGGKWQDDHVKFDGRTAIEALDAEIAALKLERDALLKVREAADALAASMEDCHMCENPCESYMFAKAYKEARDAG